MPQITIGSTIIDFPSSARNPNWAEPVIQFAQAVADALSLVVGPFDINPRVMNINNYNNVTNQALTDGISPCSFAIDADYQNPGTRSAFIRYAVYRKTDSLDNIVETGTIIGLFTGSTWLYSIDKIGDAQISFIVDSLGQVRFTTTAISGSNHVGRITYGAQGLKQNL